MNKERVIAYIDGFNLYFGMKQSKWNNLLWLDVQLLAKNLLKDTQELVYTNYFTSRIDGSDLSKQTRQKEYLEALETLNNVEIHYGKYTNQDRTCRSCGHTYSHSGEKMTDVNIACGILTDAFEDRYDTAILITGDSDLVPPIDLIHNIFKKQNKRVIVAFPPNRHTLSVAEASNVSFVIGKNRLKKSQFPNQIIKPDGYILNRPSTWI